VAAYALLFAGGLWFLRSKSPLMQKKTPAPPSPVAEREAPDANPGLSRAALLEAADLPPVARTEYVLRLSADCCPCGCDLNLRDCLLSEETCTRSPELAHVILRQIR
jgi:hypothetical protein